MAWIHFNSEFCVVLVGGVLALWCGWAVFAEREMPMRFMANADGSPVVVPVLMRPIDWVCAWWCIWFYPLMLCMIWVGHLVYDGDRGVVWCPVGRAFVFRVPFGHPVMNFDRTGYHIVHCDPPCTMRLHSPRPTVWAIYAVYAYTCLHMVSLATLIMGGHALAIAFSIALIVPLIPVPIGELMVVLSKWLLDTLRRREARGLLVAAVVAAQLPAAQAAIPTVSVGRYATPGVELPVRLTAPVVTGVFWASFCLGMVIAIAWPFIFNRERTLSSLRLLADRLWRAIWTRGLTLNQSDWGLLCGLVAKIPIAADHASWLALGSCVEGIGKRPHYLDVYVVSDRHPVTSTTVDVVQPFHQSQMTNEDVFIAKTQSGLDFAVNRFLPVIFQTLIPRSVGGSGNISNSHIQYHFDEQNCMHLSLNGVEVSSGPAHLLPGRLVSFPGYFFDYVYRCEVLRADGNDPRVFLVMLPHSRVPHLWNVVPPMRAFRPYHSGGVCAAVFNGRAGQKVHLAFTGSSHSIAMPLEWFRATMVRYSHTKTFPEGAINQMSQKHGTEPDILFPMMNAIAEAYCGKGLLGTSIGARGKGLFNDDYTPCLGMPGDEIPDVNFYAVYQDMAIGGEKPQARTFCYPFDARGAAAGLCRANDVRTIESRVVEPRNLAQEAPEQFEAWADEFIEAIAPREKLAPLTVDEVVNRMPRPSQSKGRDKTSMLWDVISPLFIRAFQKREPMAKVNDPRNISPVTPQHLVQFGKFMMALGDYFKNFEWYAFGSGSGAIARRVHLLASRCAKILKTDFSRYDATHGAWLYKQEIKLYKRCFHRIFHREIVELVHNAIGARAVTSHGESYNPGSGRLSGNNDTSLGNTFNCVLLAYMSHRQGGATHQQAMDGLGLYGGDDGFTPSLSGMAPYNFVAKVLGLRVKIEEIPSHEPLEFFGRLYTCPSGHPGSTYPLSRFLPRAHFTTASKDVSLAQAMVNRAGGFLVTDRESPLIADYAYAILRAYPKLTREIDCEARWFYENYRYDDPYPGPNMPEADVLHIQAKDAGYPYEGLVKIVEWLRNNPLYEGARPPCINDNFYQDTFAHIRAGVVCGDLKPRPRGFGLTYEQVKREHEIADGEVDRKLTKPAHKPLLPVRGNTAEVREHVHRGRRGGRNHPNPNAPHFTAAPAHPSSGTGTIGSGTGLVVNH